MVARPRATAFLLLAGLVPAAPALAASSLHANAGGPARRQAWKAVYPSWRRAEPLSAHVHRIDAEIEGARLRPLTGQNRSLSGTTPKLLVQDPNGRTFLAKAKDPVNLNFERELFATRLRQAAGEPTVPVVSKSIDLEAGRRFDGYVKPMLPAQGPLAPDPAQWTLAQRNVVLADHVWAEFLGNDDTHRLQSIVLHAPGMTEPGSMNIDWDRSLLDYRRTRPLSRFRQGTPSPPAHNLLYRSYVRGTLDLDFGPSFDAIERIHGLSDQEIRDALGPFLDRVFEAPGRGYGPYPTRDALVQAVLARRDRLRDQFEVFVRSLMDERAQRLARSPRPPRMRQILADLRDGKMWLANRVLGSAAVSRVMQSMRRLQGEP
ncbi:MAG TPA: hypothetical protein VKN99_15120 [Polyangia bacterium]|nr:hypothetical protein [Polyangia bacterium]